MHGEMDYRTQKNRLIAVGELTPLNSIPTQTELNPAMLGTEGPLQVIKKPAKNLLSV